MSAINEAYRVLADPGRRAQYDRALDGRSSSAVPPSPARTGGYSPPVSSGRYNYSSDIEPARIPWKLMASMAFLGIGVVFIGAVVIQPPAERGPDGILRPGSCVTIEPNGDAREVACTGDNDRVVDQLVPIDAPCPAGTLPHRDRQGMGTACVRRASSVAG